MTVITCFLFGTIGMGILAVRRNRRQSAPIWQAILFTTALAITGICGVKILYCLENLQDVLSGGKIGMSFFGAIFLIPIVMPFVGLLLKMNPKETLDLCAPCVAVMIGCMRVGCFLTGCCGGWVVCIGGTCFAWPTQAIESVADFAILGLFLQWESQKKFSGLMYPLLMILYSSMRFCVEFLRDTPKDWLYLSHGQWFSLLAILIGFVWVKIANRKGQNHGNPI